MHQACSVLQIWLVLSTRSCYLLWSQGDPPTEGQTITSTSLPCQSSYPGDVQEAGQGQSVLEQPRGCPVSPHTQPVLPQTLGHSGPGALPLDRSGGSCCASKWSGWESCIYPEIRSTTDNGSPSSSHVPVKGTLFLNNLHNI